MRYLLIGFILVLILLANSELSADQVYTWTDKDGNMHITAEPPPQNARVKDVIKYEPRPDETVTDAEQRRDSNAPSARGLGRPARHCCRQWSMASAMAMSSAVVIFRLS